MENMREILQLKQLNVELLQTLELMLLWFKDYRQKTDLPIPHVEVLDSLLKKADLLIDEICSPPNLQHRFRTPPDKTEPVQEHRYMILERLKPTLGCSQILDYV